MRQVTYRKRPRKTAIKRDHSTTTNSSIFDAPAKDIYIPACRFIDDHAEEIIAAGLLLTFVGGSAACGLFYQAFVM